jgi:paraquat-inducible protein B
MSVKVSKTAIGAFVLGAVALLVAGVLVLGSGKFFTREFTYITFFDGSVKGLNVGSPVMFRGVKVGSVTNISIRVDRPKHQLKIPVIFTVDPAKFKGSRAEFQRDPRTVELIVAEYGLRAQLQTLSFVTGQLVLALDFFPDKPANFVGLNKQYPEIPSIPAPLEDLRKTLEDLPYRRIVDNLNLALAGINRLVNSIDAQKTTKSLEAAIRDTRTLVQNLNTRVGPLADSIGRTARAADATLLETKEAMTDVRSEIRQVLSDTEKTLETARTALSQSEQTLQSFSDDSRSVTELNKTLREISATARSFRQLSDYLERHPESLIRGKAGKGEP